MPNMTFADLKAELEKLVPEQLKCDIACSGDDFEGGWGSKLWIAEEDWLLTEEGAEPRSVLTEYEPSELAAMPVIIPMGTPQLMITRDRALARAVQHAKPRCRGNRHVMVGGHSDLCVCGRVKERR